MNFQIGIFVVQEQDCKKSKNKEEKEEASQTLYRILFDISKLIAPFAPFMAEEIYRNLRTNKDLESVHLCDYPKPNKKLIDKQLELRMEKSERNCCFSFS